MVTKKFRNTLPHSPMANYVRRATPIAQKMWSMLSTKQKNELRRQYKDSDCDGTPNGADCHPKDRSRQEDWLPEHKELVGNISSVKPGKVLGRGCVGEVHDIKKHSKFVVKVPRINGREYSARKLSVESIEDAQRELQKEADMYKKHKLNDKPLFIPTKEIRVDDPKHKGHIALLRPKVTPITEYYPDLHFKKKPTDKQLQQLYEELMELSGQGVCFVDGLQLGVDEAGRVMVYDAGFLEFEKPGSERPYRVNDFQWQEILEVLHKQDKFPALEKPTKRPSIGNRSVTKQKLQLKTKRKLSGFGKV